MFAVLLKVPQSVVDAGNKNVRLPSFPRLSAAQWQESSKFLARLFPRVCSRGDAWTTVHIKKFKTKSRQYCNLIYPEGGHPSH